MGELMKEHWIVLACNDGWVRVFTLQRMRMIKVIKGVSGNPLCIDLAHAKPGKQHSLMAVGYEDDTFIVYSIANQF